MMSALPPGDRGETGVEGVDEGVETRFGDAGDSASTSCGRKVNTAAAPPLLLPPPLV